MLGAHYTLLKGAHIRTDMLWEKFSPRTKGRIDAVAYIFFFFPAMILLFYASVDEALALLADGRALASRPRGGRSSGRSRPSCRSPRSSS